MYMYTMFVHFLAHTNEGYKGKTVVVHFFRFRFYGLAKSVRLWGSPEKSTEMHYYRFSPVPFKCYIQTRDF